MVPLKIHINDSFFNEEIRSNYLVTKKTKLIWAIELDLLNEFDEFCRNNDLMYCVGAGTMLGAVRHKGFIPWDDDIDVYMLRPDFDKLVSLADKFIEPYYLQTTYNEKNLIRTFVRLRNTDVSATTTKERDLDIKKGVFIDIFPLDGISSNALFDKSQYLINRFQKNAAGCYNYTRNSNIHNKSFKEKIIFHGYKIVASLLIHDKLEFYERMENNLKRFSKPDTLLWGNRTLFFKCPKSRREKHDYLDCVYMPFEMLEVPVPRNYDSMLKQQYGDYMQIPKNKSGSIHGELITKDE